MPLDNYEARGEAGPDSDYDLMVIVPDDARQSVVAAGCHTRVWGAQAELQMAGVDRRGCCQPQPP
jgi:hypothetical protein